MPRHPCRELPEIKRDPKRQATSNRHPEGMGLCSERAQAEGSAGRGTVQLTHFEGVDGQAVCVLISAFAMVGEKGAIAFQIEPRVGLVAGG